MKKSLALQIVSCCYGFGKLLATICNNIFSISGITADRLMPKLRLVLKFALENFIGNPGVRVLAETLKLCTQLETLNLQGLYLLHHVRIVESHDVNNKFYCLWRLLW